MKIKQFNSFYENRSLEELSEDLGINMLDNFTKNYSEFNDNLTKSKLFLEQFENISEEIKSLVKKDEFESTLASHLIVVNDTITLIKESLKSVKKENVTLVNENTKNLTNKLKDVVDLINEEIKLQKKSIHENNFKNDEKIRSIVERVGKIDVELIESKIEDVKEVVSDINDKVEKELPRVKLEFSQYMYDNKKKVEQLENAQSVSVSVISNEISDIDKKVSKLDENVTTVNKQLPKIKKEIVSSTSNLENNLKEEISFVKTKLQEELSHKEAQIVESFKNSLQAQTQEIEKLNEELPKQRLRLSDAEVDVKKVIKDLKEMKNDRSLFKRINEIQDEVKTVDSLIEENNSKLKHIQAQVSDALKKVNSTFNEEKYYAINKKIQHMEEVLKTVNEKKLITEDIFPANPAAKTKDPLTPLNQEFVTFDQLKKHYSLFINRIQNQMMAVGGGGAGYLPDLMDVSISNPNDGEFLKYVAANNKWEASIVSTYDQDLNTTNSVTFANITATGNVVVTGDMIVLGNTTTINSSTLTVNDKTVTIASGAADSAAADGAGINVDGAQANLIYIASSDSFEFNKQLRVDNNIYTTGNINAEGEVTSPYFYSESDIVLKENVSPIDNALDKVLKLLGVSFTWKSDKRNSIGLIAQNVEEVVPQIVRQSLSGHKTVSYDSVIPLLIEAIKEQQTQINDLKKKLDEKH